MFNEHCIRAPPNLLGLGKSLGRRGWISQSLPRFGGARIHSKEFNPTGNYWCLEEVTDEEKLCSHKDQDDLVISSTQSGKTPASVKGFQDPPNRRRAPTYGQGCGIGPDFRYCKNLPFSTSAADLQLIWVIT